MRKKNDICIITQEVASTEDGKSQVIAVYRVGYFGEENTLKMIQSLSLGISLQPGTSIISDNKLLAHGKFTICTQIGCEAISTISDDDLKIIFSSNNHFLGIINGDGKQLNIPLSFNGFKAAIEAIK